MKSIDNLLKELREIKKKMQNNLISEDEAYEQSTNLIYDARIKREISGDRAFQLWIPVLKLLKYSDTRLLTRKERWISGEEPTGPYPVLSQTMRSFIKNYILKKHNLKSLIK